MIARLSILLPFTISVRHGDRLPPHEIDQGLYRMRIYPPSQAALNPADAKATSPVPLDEISRQLKPAEPQPANSMVLMNGNRTIQANLLQLDFIKDNFDRRRRLDNTPCLPGEGDPPAQLGFDLANGFLMRLRAVTRGKTIRPVSPSNTFWELQYLTDQGELLPLDPTLHRRRVGAELQWRVTGLNQDIWEQVGKLPVSYDPHPWDSILLDAEAHLPDVAPAISLANAAIESFSAWFINQIVALRGLPAGLWGWINERGDWYKEPSVAERFDALLEVFAGKSLKSETKLWEAFQNLRSARNSFSHRGKAVIGRGENAEEVTPEKATELIVSANAIVEWCEVLLPAAVRRPSRAQNVTFELRKNVIGQVFSE